MAKVWNRHKWTQRQWLAFASCFLTASAAATTAAGMVSYRFNSTREAVENKLGITFKNSTAKIVYLNKHRPKTVVTNRTLPSGDYFKIEYKGTATDVGYPQKKSADYQKSFHEVYNVQTIKKATGKYYVLNRADLKFAVVLNDNEIDYIKPVISITGGKEGKYQVSFDLDWSSIKQTHSDQTISFLFYTDNNPNLVNQIGDKNSPHTFTITATNNPLPVGELDYNWTLATQSDGFSSDKEWFGQGIFFTAEKSGHKTKQYAYFAVRKDFGKNIESSYKAFVSQYFFTGTYRLEIFKTSMAGEKLGGFDLMYIDRNIIFSKRDIDKDDYSKTEKTKFSASYNVLNDDSKVNGKDVKAGQMVLKITSNDDKAFPKESGIHWWNKITDKGTIYAGFDVKYETDNGEADSKFVAEIDYISDGSDGRKWDYYYQLDMSSYLSKRNITIDDAESIQVNFPNIKMSATLQKGL